ncbi:MAG: hypothetical protein HPY82_12695 [Gammaproteobacteria bacterium]|nr:hypothetical protein [Gammaproteobacteria bacterium]
MALPESARRIWLPFLLIFFVLPAFASNDVWQDYSAHIRQRQYAQAAQLIEPLARSRDPKACYELAQLYRNGTGVKKDVTKARQLLETAAQQGQADSQYLLGVFYSKGIGGAKDPQQAQRYLQQAAAQKHDKAEKALEQLGAVAGHSSLDAQQVTNAALKGDLATLRTAIAARQFLDATDSNGNNLLALAASRGQQPAAELLKQQGININQQNHNGETALHLAAAAQDQPMLRWLLDNGAKPDIRNKLGRTPLHIAVEKNDPAMVESMLSHHADPLIADNAGNTAVQLAQARQNAAVLLAFQRRGVTTAPDSALQQRVAAARQTTDDIAPLQLAVERGDLALVKALLNDTPDPWRPNAQGHTVITLAAQQKQSQILAYLLQSAKGKGLTGPHGRNALFFAVTADRRDNLALLLSCGADPLQLDDNKKNAVTFALENGSALSSDLLKPVPKSRWQAEWLPLAARRGLLDVTLTLINGGIDLNAQDNRGGTALWHAASQGQARVVKALLQHGADASIADNGGNTPLHAAASGKQEDIVQQLIPATVQGKQLDALNQAGSSALHLAAGAGRSSHVKLLVSAGANKDLRDRNGNTPLILAVLAHDPATVKTLLDAGASLKKRNNNSQDAHAIATQLDYREIAAQLQQAEEQSGVMSIFR